MVDLYFPTKFPAIRYMYVTPSSFQAFGYLVPSNQQSKILGVVFDSASFPEHDRKDTPSTRLTVSVK